MFKLIVAIFAVSWLLQFVTIMKSSKSIDSDSNIERREFSNMLLKLTMLMPSIILFLFIGLGRIPLDWFALGLATFNFVDVLVGFLAVVVYMSIQFIVLKKTSATTRHFSVEHDGKWRVERLGTLLHKVLPPPKKPIIYLVDILVTVFVTSVFLMPFALGEEIAWRGFIQPFFVEQFGAMFGILILGAVWAFWHLPLNLAGYNDDKNPKLTTFVFFPIGAISLAIIFGWLRIFTGSIWPVAFAHATNNLLSMFFTMYLVPCSNVKYRVVEAVVYVLLGMAGFVLIHLTTDVSLF